MNLKELASTPQLDKGRACLNCRRRKVRCDAHKPICGPCMRFSGGGLQDCEYTEVGPAQTQLLEEQISILQSRIQDLEKPPELRTSIGLCNPYTYPSMSGGPIGQSVISQKYCGSATSSRQSIQGQILPSTVLKTLIHNFLRHASQIGLFLDPQLFVDLADGSRPTQNTSPLLLNAVYLWGAYFSSTKTLSAHQPVFLAHALRNISGALQYSNGLIHAIQAEVLLAHYLFRNARVLEGKYHTCAAVSLTLSAGLHKIRSSVMRSSAADAALPPANDSQEEGERVNAFWAVLTLNNSWCAADGSPSNISYTMHGIDTPWPLNTRDYSKNSHLLPFQSCDTVVNFLANRPDIGTSAPALHAKAAILFEQASRLAGRYCDSVAHQSQDVLSSTDFRSLDELIESFKRNIPPVVGNASRTALVIHSLAHVATIQLHNPFVLTHAASQACALSAARSIVTLLSHAYVQEFEFVDAIMGTLWSAACQVFITELSRSSSNCTEEHRDALETILAVMSIFSLKCPLIEMQLSAVRRSYSALFARI